MTSAKQDKQMGVELRKIQEPSMIHVNLEKHPMPTSKMKLGAKVKMVIHGKVNSVHQDNYGKKATIEISKMDHGEDDTQDTGQGEKE